jgi:tetratricopeptide (TPR) repeat protein
MAIARVNLSPRLTAIRIRSQFLPITLRVLAAVACVFGMWSSWKIARADSLFRQDTPSSIRLAIEQEPDRPEYYIRLAQFETINAPVLLQTALDLNYYNAQAAIDLGLHYESEGDNARAEQLLLQAYSVDHTYLTRWSLANFYLRRDNMPAFWLWARRAAEMPAEDNLGALFELCWRVSPDPDLIAGNVLGSNPELIRAYLRFLLTKNQLDAAAAMGRKLVATGSPETDRSLLLDVVNQLLTAKDASAASQLWHDLIRKQWIVAEDSEPDNPRFAREPLPVEFDWSFPQYPGLHSWPGPSGLQSEFTGDEPESATIADQAIILTPGKYSFDYSYRTTDIAPDTGIQWELIDVTSDKVLANSQSLSSGSIKEEAMTFYVTPATPLLRIRLGYRRTLGTTRIAGTLMVITTGIRHLPQA